MVLMEPRLVLAPRRGVVVLALVALSGGRAWADESEQRFRAATHLLAQERYEEAGRALVALVEDEPDSQLADDALYAAAQLYEERLGDPAQALELYDRLLAAYPDSRTALAAARRAARLRVDLGPDASGGVALAAFNDIRHRYAERPPAKSMAMMEQLLVDHPSWAGTPRAVLWLAEVHEREGRLGAAQTRFAEVAERWPDTEHAFEGHRGAAQVAMLRGKLDAAERHIAALSAGRDPAKRRAVIGLRAKLHEERDRATAYTASFAVLLASLAIFLASLRLGAGSWRSCGRALARPPTEAIYFIPVAAVLGGAALTGHDQIAPAITIVLAGGLAVAWLSGAGLAVARSRNRALVHAGTAAAAVAAVIYIAVHRTRLIDLIIQTVRLGPEH